jgi:hypothetical protein
MIGLAKTGSACAFVTNLSHGTSWRLKKWLRGGFEPPTFGL